ncbi:MAG: ATP-dependent Clp protease proteolytic subunit [Elusimicrobiota bacterium]
MKKIITFFIVAVSLSLSQAQNVSTKTVTSEKDERIEKINSEKDLLKSQYELLMQKEKNRIAEIEAEYNAVSMENKLYSEKMANQIKELKSQLERISTENRLNDETNKQLLSKIFFEISKLKAENDLEMERHRLEKNRMDNEKAKMDYEIKKLDFEKEKIKYQLFLKQSEIDKLKAEIDFRDKKDELKKQVSKEIKYTGDVFKNGTLVISDRRIPLNGVITMNTADYVVSRINYFNNISSAPIFIVIDRSPGGSVMAGYKILKAMEASASPVYVVVKSYAASMAATITTLAKKSFVYPNAIILHHQMSTMHWGNMTQLKEKLEMAKKWEKRLMGPIAKKLGMDIEDFRKKMYEHNSDGDWEEFGDTAVELKWADNVVENIVEEGIIKDPDYYSEKRFSTIYEEKTDEKGKKYIDLPRLDPFDFYFIYNPDNYYRYNY